MVKVGTLVLFLTLEEMVSIKIWNASRICVSSLRRGHANLLCIVPILVYVLPKQALGKVFAVLSIPQGSERDEPSQSELMKLGYPSSFTISAWSHMALS